MTPSAPPLTFYKMISTIFCFKGNQSRAFLKKIDSLEQALQLESDDVLLNGLPIIHAFRSFSQVVDSCFGVGLKTGYEEAIREFKRCYLALGITVTPKVFIQQGAIKN